MTQDAGIVGRPRIRDDLRELVQLAWPVILSRLGIMTMGLTDVVVVGHYSAVELGYQALGWAPTGIIIMTGAGLLAGVQII
ncbi:MAG: MATE family efflux transporter, partial [Alphaproteobacteria bacterium]